MDLKLMDLKMFNYTIMGCFITITALGSIWFHKLTGEPLYWLSLVFCVGLLLHWKGLK